ncbi:MAG: hypothetical protein Q7V88_03340 [Actinomycetota bacterium]|nr:hypothetical protein [Actinomycetota bacterium]
MATDDDPITPDDAPDDTALDDTAPDDTAPDAEALDLETYDLNHDGKISPLEGMRAEIGLVDARLEEIAEQPGIKGKLADAAHHLLDKLDND